MITNIFDSHAHYDDRRFDKDRDMLLASLPEKGVCAVLNAGCDIETSKIGLALAKKHAHVYCAVGTHPHEAQRMEKGYLDLYEQLAKEEKVRAIGEIGLDYYYNHSPRDVQKRVFEQQLQLARELDMPVIIHDRDAHADVLFLLKRYRPKGVVHCYSGSAEMARELVKMGMYIGFTGVVTFANVRKVADAVKAVPPEHLLVETDCPYMAPEPFRGKRCDSSMLNFTIEAIARMKGMEPQAVADITCENAKRVFEII